MPDSVRPLAQEALPKRTRHPGRSRQAILDGAERLFAEHGYQATTMADVATAAGLSRGAPAYFFNSKDDLYRAVLGRAFEETAALIRSQRFGEEDVAVTLTEAVGSYLDFLAARPTFVRLVVRECLDGGRFLHGLPEHLMAIAEAMRGLGAERGRGQLRDEVNPAHLLLSAISLCWFPLVAVPLGEDLGLAPGTDRFLQARKEQVADLILRGALAEDGR